MAWEETSKAVNNEEVIKQKLCEDLNRLVQERSNVQFARLEELKRRLEALNLSRTSTSVPCVLTMSTDGEQRADEADVDE